MIDTRLIPCFYADGSALLLLFGLVVLFQTSIRKKDYEDHLFSRILYLSVICTIMDFIMYVAYEFEHYYFVLFFEIATEIIVFAIIIFWLYFVDYKLYHSIDHIKLAYQKWLYPAYIVNGMFVIHMFHMLYEMQYDKSKYYLEGWTYTLMLIVRYAYVLWSFVILQKYKMENGKLHYFNMWFLVIPVLAGSIVNATTIYSGRNLGLAVGITLLYFYRLNERCYEDNETGAGNSAYLEHLEQMEKEGEFSFESGLFFILKNYDEKKGQSFVSILDKEIPGENEIVNLGDGRFVMLSMTRIRAAFELISEDVEAALSEWNKNNPDAEMVVSMDFKVKKDGEHIRDFLGNLYERGTVNGGTEI